METPSLIELAKAGVHFGHHRSITYPKAKRFVFEVRKGIALINLEETVNQMILANKVLEEYLENGKTVLFVGTRRSVRHIIQEAAEKIGASFITERWFGGFLTNFATFQADIKKMNELESFLETGADKYSKKERLIFARKLTRFKRFLSGVTNLKALPDLIVVASINQDKIAVEECRKIGIPVIGLTDTDTNPENVDYAIPANDDSPASVKLIFDFLSDIKVKPAVVETAKKVEEKAETKEAKPKVVKKEIKEEKKEVKVVKETKKVEKVEKKPVAKAKAKTTKTKKGE